jgi:hypothetical protein
MRSSRVFPWPLLGMVAMACAGPITSSRPTVGAALDSASDTLLDRLRAIYDSGFAHVMAAVPDSAAEPGLWPLWALGRFKRNAVSWARLIGNGYYPLREGPAAAGWLAIVPPGHRMLRSMPSGLALDPSPTIHVVRIRPDEVTPNLGWPLSCTRGDAPCGPGPRCRASPAD